MDFIELSTTPAENPELAVILIVAGIFALAIGLTTVWRFADANIYVGVLGLVLALFGLCVGGFIGPQLLLSHGEHSKQAAELKLAVEESYGISLSDDDVHWLEYPDSKPTESLKEFGYKRDVLIPKGDSFEKQRITLLWSDGKMLLAQTSDDGKLTPLELKR
jgi:hypothetical protein